MHLTVADHMGAVVLAYVVRGAQMQLTAVIFNWKKLNYDTGPQKQLQIDRAVSKIILHIFDRDIAKRAVLKVTFLFFLLDFMQNSDKIQQNFKTVQEYSGKIRNDQEQSGIDVIGGNRQEWSGIVRNRRKKRE